MKNRYAVINFLQIPLLFVMAGVLFVQAWWQKRRSEPTLHDVLLWDANESRGKKS